MAKTLSNRARWGLAGLILLLALPGAAAATDTPFLIGVVTRFLIYGLAAVSLDLVIGYGAMVSFGHAMFFGLGGYAVGIIAFHTTEAGPLFGWAGSNAALVVWPIAMAVCALAGWLFGYLALRTRGVQFIMITLAFGQMVY
ncbi:ABC transporter permease subunit, partial [Pseudomonas aeruginosa]